MQRDREVIVRSVATRTLIPIGQLAQYHDQQAQRISGENSKPAWNMVDLYLFKYAQGTAGKDQRGNCSWEVSLWYAFSH